MIPWVSPGTLKILTLVFLSLNPTPAYAPKHYNVAVIRSLVYRAKRISSNKSLLSEAFSCTSEIFIDNGYSQEFINGIKKQLETKMNE